MKWIQWPLKIINFINNILIILSFKLLNKWKKYKTHKNKKDINKDINFNFISILIYLTSLINSLLL